MYKMFFDSELNGVFVVHYGNFEGAEHWASMFELVGDKSIGGVSNIKFIWFDTVLVESAGFEDSDMAFGIVAAQKIERYPSVDLDRVPKLVRLLDPESPSCAILMQRAQRTSGVDQNYSKRVKSYEAVSLLCKDLGLPFERATKIVEKYRQKVLSG